MKQVMQDTVLQEPFCHLIACEAAKERADFFSPLSEQERIIIGLLCNVVGSGVYVLSKGFG